MRAPWDAPVPDVDLAVKSPGVPGDVAPVLGARAAGVPVWSEIELAARELPNPLIGITGTNGKTTTTELTAHLLRAGGLAAAACGNQGTPLAGLVDASDPGAWLVVECSSFQLEDVEPFRPLAAALLNLAPDHLDRHGSLEGYRDAKLRLFAAQEAGDLAILPPGLEATGAAPARRTYDGPPGPDAVAWAEGGLHVAGLGRVVAWDEVALRGRHNRENAMAAAALAAHAGLGAAALAEGLASFRPVPHRLEPVGTAGGVAFVNDSKATNPDAAIAALDAYPRGAPDRRRAGQGHALRGPGRGRAGRRRARVPGGRGGEEIGRALRDAGVPEEASGTVEAAVAAAAARAAAGETVLLSPGCASFDQFADYQERGRRSGPPPVPRARADGHQGSRARAAKSSGPWRPAPHPPPPSACSPGSCWRSCPSGSSWSTRPRAPPRCSTTGTPGHGHAPGRLRGGGPRGVRGLRPDEPRGHAPPGPARAGRRGVPAADRAGSLHRHGGQRLAPVDQPRRPGPAAAVRARQAGARPVAGAGHRPPPAAPGDPRAGSRRSCW